MKTLTQTIHIPMYAEAAEVVPAMNNAPCRHELVTDRRPFGSALSLAERCAR
jgi:hypothetical protein